MNVLLTSIGRRTYLVEYFQEALRGRGKVIAANTTLDAAGMLVADVACLVPPPTDPGYIDEVLKICANHDVKLVLSLHDWEAPRLSANVERFRSCGVLLAVSRPEVIELCLDKFKTYEFARRHALATPKTFTNLTTAQTAIKSGDLKFPLIVKPRRGQGSVGLDIAENELELEFCLGRGLRLCAQIASNGLLPADGGKAMLIQEHLTGIEYGLDVVNDFEGRFVCCLVKRKFEMRAGETDAAEAVRSPVLEKLGRRLGELIGHVGMLDVDIMMVEDIPYLLELNPRIGGHYPFAHAAGANIPAAMIAWASGETPRQEWFRLEPGVKSFKGMTLLKGTAASRISVQIKPIPSGLAQPLRVGTTRAPFQLGHDPGFC
jgi:carbamoyl-phosphate synthase large subunit